MKKLHAIYLLNIINSFSGSLIGIFVPIYLLVEGYPLVNILYFLATYSIATLACFFLIGYFSARFSIRSLLIIRLPFLFIYLAVLYFLGDIPVPLAIIAIFYAIEVSLFWYSFHVMFAKNSTEENLGREMGILMSLPKFICIIAPLIGGLVSVAFGFKALFFLAMVINLFSIVPLLYLPAYKSTVKMDMGNFKKMFLRNRKYFWAEIMENISEESECIIWPIFVFLAFNDILSIGAVGSIAGIGGALFTYLVGKYVDKYQAKKVLRIGAVIMIAIWLMRYFLAGEYVYYLLTLLAGFFSAMILLPFGTIIYKTAKQENIEEFIIFREIPVVIGRVIVYAFCLLFVSKLNLSFILIALSYFYFFIF
jgi:predicted MFS family arabinose efflux permease